MSIPAADRWPGIPSTPMLFGFTIIITDCAITIIAQASAANTALAPFILPAGNIISAMAMVERNNAGKPGIKY